MKPDIMPISRQLAALAAPELSDTERQHLAYIINHLFSDLDSGHSCSRLNDLASSRLTAGAVIKLLLKSKLAAKFDMAANKLEITPLSIVEQKGNETLIYISRYLHYELSIARQIKQLTLKANLPDKAVYTECIAVLERQQSDLPNQEQLEAIKNSLNNKLSFITGGPGTGKTTTVTLLLWLMYQLYGPLCKIKICAPTGKAAARVKDSMTKSVSLLKKLNFELKDLDKLLGNSNNFGTIHKLLGFVKNSIYFRHHEHNPLDIDILIVDESSMISLPLYSKLLQALNCRQILHVIFLGDKNQLSSVEEGYVFGSLIGDAKPYDLFNNLYAANVQELIVSKRNSGDVGILAQAILKQNIAQIDNLLADSAKISLKKLNLGNILQYLFAAATNSITSYINFLQNLDSYDYRELFAKFNQQIILCLTNVGIYGSINLNQQIEKQVKLALATIDTWYTGRPVIILENDYSIGLHNGDVGICIAGPDKTYIIFEDGKEYIPEVLPHYQLAYAITIHKSQGSEYEHVNVVLPAGSDEYNLCSRELIYTAVTRARESVTIFSNKDIIEQAVANITKRNTGLNYLLN